jgi:hypothetical protein
MSGFIIRLLLHIPPLDSDDWSFLHGFSADLEVNHRQARKHLVCNSAYAAGILLLNCCLAVERIFILGTTLQATHIILLSTPPKSSTSRLISRSSGVSTDYLLRVCLWHLISPLLYRKSASGCPVSVSGDFLRLPTAPISGYPEECHLDFLLAVEPQSLMAVTQAISMSSFR